MTDAISHRGPDGEGHWIDGSIGLGHRRLSIIDLSPLGHQPMMSQDGRYVLSYNGEIYNFRELRAELETKGYGFRSTSDSEVLLTALQAWGPKALDRLNGMFAFALWDRREKTLMLARDRYGIKPLYVGRDGARFGFASEQKAIMTLPGFPKQLNAEALYEYFTFQNLFTDQTLVKNIMLVPAGHYCIIDTEVGAADPGFVQYWDYN
ncbi:MAG: asparagine synthetase B family protein, partial [Planktomarina sp.]